MVKTHIRYVRFTFNLKLMLVALIILIFCKYSNVLMNEETFLGIVMAVEFYVLIAYALI